MSEFSVFSREQAGACTHALVIGVGYYPHLVGGDEEKFADCEGMGQLSSPPYSARMIAEWLISRFSNPDKPLSTVSLLVSEREQQPFMVQPALAGPVLPKIATMENVEQAVKAWKDKGDENENNLLLFFFCGHGFERGTDVILLPQDFGKDQDDPLDMALNLNNLHSGMGKCKASQQCYFIDSCRSVSSTLLLKYSGEGRQIIAGSAKAPGKGPIFCSTLAGEAAFGRAGRETVFTEILLKSLNGCGSDNNNDDETWRVDTINLHEAICTLLREHPDARQAPEGNRLPLFYLHYLDGAPKIPVTVTCRPEEKTDMAFFSCSDDGVILARRDPSPGNWLTDILVGQYRFSAEFADQTPFNKDKVLIRPPSRKVILEDQQ
ncbi:MAG: caspase family protein [Desulfoprunum sp.]|nr:caspase family protein [Desulfoprunum sp.]